jgi:hypothetical protein
MLNNFYNKKGDAHDWIDAKSTSNIAWDPFFERRVSGVDSRSS